MTPAVTAVRMSGARHRVELPLLVLGPALGTSASALWSACATSLADSFDVLAWDLPGHGHNRAVPEEPFTMAELAVGVLRVVDDVLEQRDDVGGPFRYAGDCVGGAVGLQLLLDAPERVESAVLLCTAARIGSPAAWAGRVGQVSVSGTPVMAAGSAEQWFGPGFRDRHPERGAALLASLRETSDEGYIEVCAALADFDVRDRLADIGAPVLAVAGGADRVTPPQGLRAIADEVPGGRFVELEGVAHLAPAEAPEAVAALLRRHLLGETPAGEGADAAGFARELEDLVALSAGTDLGARPGLDRRSRSMVTLAALVAAGRHDDVSAHLRAALRDGLDVEEIREILVQSAVRSGAPDAGTAFRVVQQVLEEEGKL